MTHADPSLRPRKPLGPLEDFLAPLPPMRPLGATAKFLLVVFGLLALWGVAILSFGIPALVWPMKLIVPACVITLVAITWSK